MALKPDTTTSCSNAMTLVKLLSCKGEYCRLLALGFNYLINPTPNDRARLIILIKCLAEEKPLGDNFL